MSSVFVRPSSRDVSMHAIAFSVRNWVGAPITRMDIVDSASGAFYCFVHFACELPKSANDILRTQQVTVPAVGGWIVIGQNKSSGYDSQTPDCVSHMVYTETDIFFVYREGWATYVWSPLEENWVQSDIAVVASYIPDMPETSITESIVTIITDLFNELTLEDPKPPAIKPKQQKKRYFKTTEESELVRQLFV